VTPIALSLLTFALALVGILVGSFMQRVLPEGHLSSDSKEVVKLSMGVVGTLTALVLGLLIASAKSSYDARESEVKQLTAYVILLDTLLAQYGEEAQPARASLRQAVPAVADRIWREGFGGFSLMARANATTLVALVICALSVSGAIFLILELDQPFAGLMTIPSEPLRNALSPLVR
jgi:hypothetical protein